LAALVPSPPIIPGHS